MQSTRFVGFFMLLLALLSGCQGDDPLQELIHNGEQLQKALEEKDVSAVKALLHSDFQVGEGRDLAWAERSMRLAFLRNKHIRIMLLRQEHRLDNSYHDRAQSTADIAVTGAEGLLPERGGHYRVELQWWLEDGQWRLARLNWQ